MTTATETLADARRLLLRTQFKEAVAAGTARWLVIPYSLAGAVALPVLYLAIPHTRRPWLYQARFAVVAAVVAFNIRMMSETASTNMASAYVAGLVGTWGIIWAMTLLVWMRPQFEAARVERRRKSREGEANGTTIECAKGHIVGDTPGKVIENGHSSELQLRGNGLRSREQKVPDESIAAALEDGYEYYWQPYPEHAPLLTRLEWAFDLVTAFRGSGWNHCISSIPHFARPENPQSAEPVDLDSMPLVTPAGYSRQTTYRAFIMDKIRHMAWGYLVLDFCSVFMTKDPYFVFGPESPHPLPSHLQSLHPAMLSLCRSSLAFFGILSALFTILSFDQLARGLLLGPAVAGARGDLWAYPSLFGSFDAVLDDGLAGFWRAWWHQSFRLAFLAPTAWLVRSGRLLRGATRTKAVGSLIAFALSGCLHAGGSFTTVPREVRWWLPPLFFMLQPVGIAVQALFCARFGAQVERLPRVMRRTANLAFVVLWLHATQWAFIDDLGRSALWLFEPVPISPLRALGFGQPGESWWRWDRDHFPVWYWGRNLWESGIGI